MVNYRRVKIISLSVLEIVATILLLISAGYLVYLDAFSSDTNFDFQGMHVVHCPHVTHKAENGVLTVDFPTWGRLRLKNNGIDTIYVLVEGSNGSPLINAPVTLEAGREWATNLDHGTLTVRVVTDASKK